MVVDPSVYINQPSPARLVRPDCSITQRTFSNEVSVLRLVRAAKHTRKRVKAPAPPKVHTTTSRHEVRHSACRPGERQSRPGRARACQVSESPGKLRDIYHTVLPVPFSRFTVVYIFLDPVPSLLVHDDTVQLHPIVVLPNICTFYFIQIDRLFHTWCERDNSHCQTCISDTSPHGCHYKQSWAPHCLLLT